MIEIHVRVITLQFQVTLKWHYLTLYYCLHQSAIGFSKEAQMGYLCKTIVYDCAYACASHLVQLK